MGYDGGDEQQPPERVRLALVGCGYWGPKVLRAAASLRDVHVAALVDLDLALAQGLQRHYPLARTATSLSDVLSQEPIDAVIVATNPRTHVELAAESLEAGKHVLVEKPLALSAADCRSLGDQARAAGLVCMAGHTFLFSPSVRHVRELLTGGELGELYYVDSQRLNLGRVRQDVDAIWNFAPHDISIINHWVGGPPQAVHCHAYDYLQGGIPDLAYLMLEYESAVAHIQVSWLSPNKVRQMTVVGSERMVVYDDVADRVAVHHAGIDRQRVDERFADFETFGQFRLIQRMGDVHLPRIEAAEPLVVECRHFVDCIRSGEEPITNSDEAAAVVEVLEAATASRSEGGARVETSGLRQPAAAGHSADAGSRG